MDDNDLLPKKQSINLAKPLTFRSSVISRPGSGLEPLIANPRMRRPQEMIIEES